MQKPIDYRNSPPRLVAKHLAAIMKIAHGLENEAVSSAILEHVIAIDELRQYMSKDPIDNDGCQRG